MATYPLLFRSLRVGPIVLPNRILMGSMGTGFEGLPDGPARLAEFYAERARGGAALIVTGAFSPNLEGCPGPDRTTLVDEDDRDRARLIADAVHAAGGRILLQILHAGRYSMHGGPVAPSAIRSPIGRVVPRALSTAEVERTVDDYVRTAELAQQAGFDGVEVMGSEGYLITQFLCRRTNRRTDAWGGAFENRMRFPVEIVRRIRERCGPDFVVQYRISVLDLVEGGLDGDEVLALARAIEAAGADSLNSGVGWHEARVPTISNAVPRAAFSWATRRVREAVSIPVIASNRINAPEVAEEILARGDADMVSMARPMLADPEFANKAKAGDRAGINVCFACNQACLDEVLELREVRCVVNPRAGRETQLVYRPVTAAKRIAVVGGGPAGLSFAAVAAERGHRITLYEKAPQLGGQFNLARQVPGKQEFGESAAYYAERVRRAGVRVLLEHEADAAELAAYDEVVLASGVTPRRPQIPGVDHGMVVGYEDVLTGRVPVGRRVVILGAGGIGFDVALFLVSKGAASDAQIFRSHWGVVQDGSHPGGLVGALPREEPHARQCSAHRITMLKRSSTPFGSTLGKTTGWIHRLELARAGVEMLAGVEYRRIDDAGVHVMLDMEERLIPADTVVLCTGQEPVRALAGQLVLTGPGVHLIGGAREAGELDARRAIREGAELAAEI